MTLPRLNALTKHWEKSPPVHVTAALFAGIERKPTSTAPAAPSGPAVLPNPLYLVEQDSRKLVWNSQRHG